jgi:hypothetical protein
MMRCGECGAVLTIVSGRKGHHPARYGCPQNFNRGACTNDLKERQDWIERQLLLEIRKQVLTPELIAYVIQEVGSHMRARLGNLSEELAQMRKQKAALEAQIAKLLDTAEAAGHSPSLLSRLAQREDELRAITDRLLSEEEGSLGTDLERLQSDVTKQLARLEKLVGAAQADATDDVAQGAIASAIAMAREELRKHITPIIMKPDFEQRQYTAEGAWDLLGNRSWVTIAPPQ